MRLSAWIAPIVFWSLPALAQMAAPEPAPLNGALLFRNQCATCHTLKASDPQRQGPTLEHVVGRKIGAIEGYKYTAGYRESADIWDDARLDKYLTNPQAMFPGSTMAYKQAKPDVRAAIIAYLKEQG